MSDGNWFREEYERAKARNALIPLRARMIITNPCLAGDHSRCDHGIRVNGRMAQ